MACPLLFIGCEPPAAETRLNEYLTRLSRPLDQPAPALPANPNLSPPRAASLLVPVAGGTLDGVDFLRLRGCALQATIARRNSSLGRVAPPSQRLLLELAFLREAPECISKLRAEGRAALADLLEQNYALKQTQLPVLIFNATLGSDEFRDFWRSTEPLGYYPQDTSSLPVSALETLVADSLRWLQGDYSADEKRFELALSAVAQGDGGELLRALSLQQSALSAANFVTAPERERGGLCSAMLRPRSAQILRNVVTKYFVRSVQPWSAQLNARFHQLLPPILRLESAVISAVPDEYREWQTRRDQSLEHSLAAPSRHVREIQELLGGCYPEFAAPPPA
ncbi:MAG: DUF3080 family protein [Pseudomonadota bacterium]